MPCRDPGVHDDREPERRRLDAGDLRGPALVGGDEDAVVVRHPHAVRRSRTLHEAVDVLRDGVMGQLGGTYSARMPSPRSDQLAPASSVNQRPPVETATHTRFALRGSTQIECMPGRSAPPPIHCVRLG